MYRMRNTSASPLIIKTAAEQVIEHRFGASMPELLDRLYNGEALTQAQVADRLGTPRKNVVVWMVKYGIPTRDRRALATEAVAS